MVQYLGIEIDLKRVELRCWVSVPCHAKRLPHNRQTARSSHVRPSRSCRQSQNVENTSREVSHAGSRQTLHTNWSCQYGPATNEVSSWVCAIGRVQMQLPELRRFGCSR